MTQSETTAKTGDERTANWKVGTTPLVLQEIHHEEINITIFERDISVLSSEVNRLLEQEIEVRLSGEIESLLKEIRQVVTPDLYGGLIEDITTLLATFQEVTKGRSFRLMLATINSNMCRKFHTDINDVRLLCTYSGPGTLWLTEDNINRKAVEAFEENGQIIRDESQVRQAATGAVVLLKGAIYPKGGTKAVVHRSPTIEESGQKRLLLRIDTNELFVD